ncbi:MAG: UDP-3-O-(3-hydroxymyristoyl)glucosamine N-acyltransferase [Myxococcales bacterium]|nr:MAG: UDP-3-O-(3-hydroxymyristoyl)glucosamine N-acyltransferase [Myxococcales bacterium]
MADPRFFAAAGPFTLRELATIAGAEIANGDEARRFVDVAPLGAAGPEDVSFLDNRRYLDAFRQSRAGACLVAPDAVKAAPSGMNLLIAKDPYRAYAKVAAAFHPPRAFEPGIHPAAHIGKDARIGEGCRIEAGAAIGARADIGRRCHIAANAVIGEGVAIGDDGWIGPGVSISHAVLGRRAIVHGGARIGQDGFGFALGPQGHLKVPQLGRVVIGDDVEIGANTTIDRGAGPDTVVGDGTKIDNLVQIAHNVRIGRGCVIVAQVGISGSTRIGDFVMLGGQAGLTGHLEIGDGAKVAAQAGVMRDIEPGVTVGGSPAVPQRQWLKGVALIERMTRKD